MSKPGLYLGKTPENLSDRRAAETARKARIFNTRLRVMGIDTDALNKQVEEKKHRQNMEMQLDKNLGNLCHSFEKKKLNCNRYSLRT